MEALGFVLGFHQDDTVLEFLEVRRILEPSAAAMAASAMSEEGLAGLRELLDGLGEDLTLEEVVANDLEFHRWIAVGSGNSVLRSLIEGLAESWSSGSAEGSAGRTPFLRAAEGY